MQAGKRRTFPKNPCSKAITHSYPTHSYIPVYMYDDLYCCNSVNTLISFIQLSLRVPCWAPSKAPTSYLLTSFRFDHRAVLCWLVECTTVWMWWQHSEEHAVPCLIAADVSLHLWTCTITNLRVLFGIRQSFTLLQWFSMRAKHRGGLSSCGLLFVTFSLAEEVWVIGSSKPCICPLDHWSSPVVVFSLAEAVLVIGSSKPCICTLDHWSSLVVTFSLAEAVLVIGSSKPCVCPLDLWSSLVVTFLLAEAVRVIGSSKPCICPLDHWSSVVITFFIGWSSMGDSQLKALYLSHWTTEVHRLLRSSLAEEVWVIGSSKPCICPLDHWSSLKAGIYSPVAMNRSKV